MGRLQRRQISDVNELNWFFCGHFRTVLWHALYKFYFIFTTSRLEFST